MRLRTGILLAVLCLAAIGAYASKFDTVVTPAANQTESQPSTSQQSNSASSSEQTSRGNVQTDETASADNTQTPATVAAPPASPASQRAWQLAQTGDSEGARRAVEQGLAENPADPRLHELQKLLEPKVHQGFDANKWKE